jgi:hypothetical protein
MHLVHCEIIEECNSRHTHRLRGHERPNQDVVCHEHVRRCAPEFRGDRVGPMGEPELGARLLFHRAERPRGPAEEQPLGRRRRVPGVDLWLPQPHDLSAGGLQRLPQGLAHRQPRAAHAGTDEDPDPMPARDQTRHDGEELRNVAPIHIKLRRWSCACHCASVARCSDAAAGDASGLQRRRSAAPC